MKKTLKRITPILVVCIFCLICTTLLFSSCVDGSDKLTYQLTSDGKGYIVTGCTSNNASTITIPSEYEGLPVKEIGERAFAQMKSLKTVTFPDGIEIIGYGAFMGCEKIEELTLPKGLKKIGAYAFQSCFKLKNVTLYDELEEIGSQAFLSCKKLSDLEIPKSLHTLGGKVFQNTMITGETINGVTYYHNWVIGSDSTAVNVQLRQDTVGIANGAFEGNTVLESVNFGDSLLYIGASAFNDCTSLSELHFSSSIERIGERAFNDCALDSFTFPGSLKYVGSIPVGYDTSDPLHCEYDGTTAMWISISEDASAAAQSTGYKFAYTVECIDGTIGQDGKVK